jgi:anti-sigma factor RsiW
MDVCDFIDRYRDGELDERQRQLFESHLPGCSGCRLSVSILNNLVRSLNWRPYDVSLREAQQIARQARRQRETWDLLVISWLRPIPAWTLLGLAIAFYSGLGLFSPGEPKSPTVEYEALVREMESKGFGKQQPQLQSDADLLRWLEQQGSQH